MNVFSSSSSRSPNRTECVKCLAEFLESPEVIKLRSILCYMARHFTHSVHPFSGLVRRNLVEQIFAALNDKIPCLKFSIYFGCLFLKTSFLSDMPVPILNNCCDLTHLAMVVMQQKTLCGVVNPFTLNPN